MLTTRLEHSAEYTARREALREAEIELMRQRERVAALRRDLPEGVAVEDYVFLEGPQNLDAGDAPETSVRLSELFSGPGRSLVIYQLMYGKAQTTPCPMCTMWVDGLNAVAPHLLRNVDVAIAAAADTAALRAHARDRGWDKLRLLSCGESSFQFDLGAEELDGSQDSTISVFTQDPDGKVRHFYSAHPRMSDEIFERGIDLVSPVWHALDLTPEGRGDWYPSLRY
jgi:predicted dithiol-disulfide oxidoreductase (DUF899 family)